MRYSARWEVVARDEGHHANKGLQTHTARVCIVLAGLEWYGECGGGLKS